MIQSWLEPCREEPRTVVHASYRGTGGKGGLFTWGWGLVYSLL